MEETLIVKDLHKFFFVHILNDKEINALEGLNFSLKKGEIVGLAGKSGSGKSTLIKCIYRTNLTSSGQIIYKSKKYGEIDLTKASDYQILNLRKTEMTYCSQFLSVIPRVTAVDVVAESLITKGYNWDAARKTSKEYLSRLRLPEELWDAYPSTFSGGEQQRINVARAIISEPDFLLIDEPTASLDEKTKDVVIDMVLKLKEKGSTVLCITHDPYTMEKLTDRSIYLKHGKIIEEHVASVG